jgi:hypothetical protein
VPDIMPHAMEKGGTLSVIESFVNGSKERALKALRDLRAGVPVVDIGALSSQNLYQGTPWQDREALVRRISIDWWGMKEGARDPNNQPTYTKQQPWSTSNPTTGFWLHWHGDAEGVFRETMIRALEVSLGMAHEKTQAFDPAPKPVNDAPTRHWPISIYWNCPHPWYEGWVCWLRHDETPAQQKAERAGRVIVVVHTPAHGGPHSSPLFNSPVRYSGLAPGQPYQLYPTGDAPNVNGMWVVSQLFHAPWDYPSGDAEAGISTNNAPSGSAQWSPPVLGRPHASVGPVVVVAPSERDGGVMPNGRAFQPPR